MSFNCFFRNAARRALPLTLTVKPSLRLSLPKPPPCHNLKQPPHHIPSSHFHVSSPRNALPPIFVILARYATKVGAIISGRLLRKWWNRLSPEEKEKVIEQIRSGKTKIAFGVAIFAGTLFIYYIANIVENPITKRKRFMILSQKQLKELGDFEYQRQLTQFRAAIVPPVHPVYRRVIRVVNNLVLSNIELKEIKDTVWSVTVVDRPDITNAFSLPQGQIFVFTGMLNLCTNDDQLAIVLAHEMAHTILSHLSELMSKAFILDIVLLVPTVLLWMIFSDTMAIFSEWVKSTLADLLITLPNTRALEREADFVGLQMAARSCYDVREAPLFWRKMQSVTQMVPADWMSTHPSSASREREMVGLMPAALQLREAKRCPPLRARSQYGW